jgi:hypothetical protein
MEYIFLSPAKSTEDYMCLFSQHVEVIAEKYYTQKIKMVQNFDFYNERQNFLFFLGKGCFYFHVLHLFEEYICCNVRKLNVLSIMGVGSIYSIVYCYSFNRIPSQLRSGWTIYMY